MTPLKQSKPFLTFVLLQVVVTWWLPILISPVIGLSNHDTTRDILKRTTATLIQQAMMTTNDFPTSISKAYLACDQWTNILSQEISPNIRSLCLAFQASCLTRVGRDLESLQAYSSCLELQMYLDPNTLQDVQLGKAYALQRLMRYSEAYQQYRTCSTEKASIGAATCALRLMDYTTAVLSLTTYCKQHQNATDANGLLGCLLYLTGKTHTAIQSLQVARTSSPLYSWVHCLATKDTTISHQAFTILQYAAVNQCPLDDPLLWYLDDKVHLHNLLSASSTTLSWWPPGYTLPRDLPPFQESHGHCHTTDWILKQRAGYGSHGHCIRSAADIISQPIDSEILCQRMVHPTLLLENRKFSMRIYLYLFLDKHNATPSVYLSTLGLVKFAAKQFDPDSDDERMFLTNSGREDVMDQRDLIYLKAVFDKNHWSYEEFWSDIRQSIQTLMKYYSTLTCTHPNPNKEYRCQLSMLGIPKIVGLDFLVDDKRQPKLIEVNRFPGLEPRGNGDETVKLKVVQEAWLCAADRLGVAIPGEGGFKDSIFSDYNGIPSFEKVL